MNLGTRWEIGAEPPARLPDSVVVAIAAVETELVGVDTTGWRWTLTWLEGRPVVELDPSTGSGRRATRLRLAPDGSVLRDQLD
ncbi:MAG: hypothetical protein QM675_03370 [Protaetiibacter sp.]